ncbi:MAG: DMT family transporter [Chitinophagaceae bacterium]|jgi:drug/metabolite transporter (DMT)-like permease|nr:DMT family transporter [Chitinophagaceae bacterium]MBK7678253.1 DMT family transporter [Chitinophagaceae bacterium]MBK8301544.1 DMT family transporter [Chitinophagaceae bacterium]MBK9464557.1 DMT family transporter [Chitinophagaceae bacterium]MBK9660087.1 DMT family transporter [Chitinophagaceae bacterium]
MKKAFLQLHIAVFLAGFTGILGRLITLNEGMIVWYRLLLTSITMWILFGLMKKLQKIPVIDILKIAGVGFIAAMHWVTFYGSIKYSNVSVALVCFSAISFFTALFEPVILRKKINWTELLLGLITLSGIYIIFHFDTQYKTGIIIGIISAVLASLFPIFNREFLKRTNVETMLTWQQTGGLLTLSILLPFYLQKFPIDSFIPSMENLGWLLVLSWFCSVIAFQFSSNALKRLSAFTVNLTYNLEPVYGIILAFMVYKENQFLSKWFFVGFAIIAVALIIHLYLLLKVERKLTEHAAD